MSSQPDILDLVSFSDPEVIEGAALSWRLSRVAGPTAELLATSMALLLLRRRQGHLCLHLAEWSGRRFPEGDPDTAPQLPPLEDWQGGLAESELVGDGTTPSLLVLDPAGRLYLYRDHRAERELARRLRRRLENPGLRRSPASSAVAFDDPELQRRFETALQAGLTLVTGGPGTGKTTAVGRVLALLLRRDPTARVLLAAPTGKAAARLAQSLRQPPPTLALTDAERAALPTEVHTLHRLLRYHPGRARFGHDEEHPLDADVVVVDEASMVDLHLMLALVRATPPSARLLLVGDPAQLASIEAGTVLADLRRAAHDAPADSALAGCLVELVRNWRSEDRPGITRLAAAVREGDAAAALAVLDDPSLEDARWAEGRRPHALLVEVESLWGDVLAAVDAREALDALGRGRILCALREGPAGVGGLRRSIESHLAGEGLDTRRTHYRGQPVLVLENDVELGLNNGDLGVCVGEGSRLRVAFEGGAEGIRTFSPHRLPRHETAWAMTVHKSQGSEFDRVWLVLPPRGHPLATRELLYTGVTRARESVVLFGDAEALRDAVTRQSQRHSGLVELMREVDS